MQDRQPKRCAITERSGRNALAVLLFTVLAGLLLRAVLLAAAEHCLDCDESVVAFMGLDVLEGRARPVFFYGNAYNGGAALEAYLAAAGFRVFGFHAAVVKGAVLLLWFAAAIVLGDLCRRLLSPSGVRLALVAFCLATPFQLEWSLKARGGFVETVLLSTLLLWLLFPPEPLRRRRFANSLLVGLAIGIGWWLSQMLLPLAVCVAFWIVARAAPRRSAIKGLALGTVLGLLPLVAYNVTHHWANVTESALAGIVAGGTRTGALSARQFSASLHFVFGPLWWLVGVGLAVACCRVRGLQAGDRRQLAGLLLVHTLLYLAAYWFAGLRALPVPPSRVLLAVYPGVAILLGIAADGSRWGRPRRVLSYVFVGAWVVLALVAAVSWALTGRPREQGSWRGTWSLVDAHAVDRVLSGERVETVYTNYWTAWPVALAARVAGRAEPAPQGLLAVQARHVVWLARQQSGRGLVIRTALPQRRAPLRQRVALLVVSGSTIQRAVERALEQQGTHYRRSVVGDLVLITGLSAAQLPMGLDAQIDGPDAWPPLPDNPDGFN